MIIAHNLSAMNAQRQLGIVAKKRAKATERLSSGYRINRAADDAANLAISEKMRAQIRGLDKGSQNVQHAIGFCNVAEGALQEVHSILGRVKELAVQAASDTYVEQDRQAIEDEFVQLKKEINNISRTTEYNTMRIFDEGKFDIEFSDTICPIKIFNSSFGNPDSPDTYGGIIVGDDVRVAWTDIDPQMVSADPDTGDTVFRAGEYEYTIDGYDFTITCEAGSKPPQIKVEFEVSANSQGIYIAGDTIVWEDIINEDGESILDHLGEEGSYFFRHGGGEGGFYVPEGMGLPEIIRGINDYNEKSNKRYYSVYNGYYTAQAVDVQDAGSKVQITQEMYDEYINNSGKISDPEIELCADEDGIWIADKAGNEIAGTKKTWAQMKLEHWDSTNDVSDQKKYTYECEYSYDYTDPATGAITPRTGRIDFDFFLLDETSKESVISGINEMKLESGSSYASNKTTEKITTNQTDPATNIISGKMTYCNNALSLEEEGSLNRDFSVKEDTLVNNQSLSYDAVSNEMTWGVGQGLEYEAVNMLTAAELETAAKVPLQYLAAKTIRQAMKSLDASGPVAGTPDAETIADIIGADKITSSGYLSEDFTVTADTIKTGGLGSDTYAAASVDFSELGTKYQLYDLLGSGFDSTCMTCDNHYSVMFVYGGTTAKTASGYGYATSQDGRDYTLMIDLKDMMEQGINDGEAFTKALIEVLDEDAAHFDFHFTQYAAEGSKLYICDNRKEYVGNLSQRQNADFYIQPYNINGVDVDINLQNTTSGRGMKLGYTYDIASQIGSMPLTMVNDANGLYVEDPQKAGTYVRYDSSNTAHAGLARWNLGQGAIDWEDAYDKMMTDIAQNTKLSIKTTDYAFLNCSSNENPNEAYVSKFRFQIEEDEDGMWIQSGANRYQGVRMKWDGFSSYYLGLEAYDMTSREGASELIRRADAAIRKISGIRSAFGAYTNRLERMYDMNQNYAENLQAAESKIRDTDMAAELMQDSKHNILAQAVQSMLAHANQNGEGILSLLQ